MNGPQQFILKKIVRGGEIQFYGCLMNRIKETNFLGKGK